ncbi:MAG: hypothetical protein RBU45_18685 [Myxococcota bacterium]|jgi:hypothetical protein|nr:hypothetical protein [Myxococcota bacterium]
MKQTLIAALLISLLAALVAIARLNLPPDDVAGHVTLPEDTGLLLRATQGAVLSDTVAGWQYRDFLVFKTATSARLGMTFVALPFGQWQRWDEAEPADDE